MVLFMKVHYGGEQTSGAHFVDAVFLKIIKKSKLYLIKDMNKAPEVAFKPTNQTKDVSSNRAIFFEHLTPLLKHTLSNHDKNFSCFFPYAVLLL